MCAGSIQPAADTDMGAKEKLRSHEGQLKEEALCSLPLQITVERVAIALAEMEAEVHCPEPFVWACRWRDPYSDSSTHAYFHSQSQYSQAYAHAHAHALSPFQDAAARSSSGGPSHHDSPSMVVFALEVFRVAKIPGLTSIDMRHLAGDLDAFASAQQVFYVRCDLTSPPDPPLTAES